MTTFPYSEEFVSSIRELHRGKEQWPQYAGYIEAHLGGPEGRIHRFAERLVPELEHHCGSLLGRRVLDFGCGTGATSVAMAHAGADVTGFDIDAESAAIARLRAREHGVGSRVDILSAQAAGAVALLDFDVVLMNGVLEHVPMTVPDLRESVLRTAWSAVRRGGYLFFTETPNRLLPYDFHSTQLWWVPWARPGSPWAYAWAVARGRHADSPTATPGPRGLEEVGAWGATYWEIRRVLESEGALCVNLLPGHDAHVWYTGRRSWRGLAFDAVMHEVAVKRLGVPITAFAPFLTNLAFRKGAPADA